MITLGVDLAAQPEKTAACVIEWRNKEASVTGTRLAVDDDDLLKLIVQADKAGLDVPFGWPDAFVQGVCAHHNSPISRRHGWPANMPPGVARYRATDGSKNQETLNELATKLIHHTMGWLQVPTATQQLLQKTDHLFDALVAALIARAAAIGECEDIPSGNVRNAKREGWIVVPKVGSLEKLSRTGVGVNQGGSR